MAISSIDDNTSAISSDAFTMGVCTNDTTHTNCSPSQSYRGYPGQKISVVGLDLYGNVSPSIAVLYTVDFDTSSGMLLSLQCNQKTCYDYVVQSKCPLGFVLNDTSETCMCNQFLLEANLVCSINNLTVLKLGSQWVGSISNSVVVYDSCPYDYCAPSPISVSLSSSDDQCNDNRGGVLCGACIGGRSAMFGTSRCMSCSNYHIFHLVTCAVMGVALITTLLVLNITVSSGTINGLIFYANVIG